MKKITIMALHLGFGGIEKAISDLANGLSKNYNVEIVSTYKLYNEPSYKLDSKIKVTYLLSDLKPNKDELKKSIKKFRIISFIKESIKSIKILRLRKECMIKYVKNLDSDVIISTRDFHNEILGKYADKSIVKIGWEHNHHNNKGSYFNKIVKSVRNLDYFVLVSEELYKDYNKALNEFHCKCVYIPNMINNENVSQSKLDNNNLISVSRLSKEKGLLDLIDVIGIVKKEIPSIKLNLIGNGSQYNEIKEYISNKELDDSIEMLGFKKTEDVYDYLSKSSLYIMTSYTESFGIVLLESFSCGVPAVAFDSAQGARSLINNDNGVLIKNRSKQDMADWIINYLKSDRKKYLGKVNNGLEIYKQDNVINKWENLFTK